MSIYDSYNLSLTKDPLFSSTPEFSNVFTNGISSRVIGSGDEARNANLVDGYLQSGNFVTGSVGWQIKSDGIAEFESGYFRGDITAATGLFGGTIGFENVAAGTNANALNVGSGNVKIDGANERILINDGTNDRVLIGKAAGLF